MTEFEIALLSGVVAGLLTSLLLLLLGSYWRNILRPWLEDWVYRGTRIDGAWKGVIQVAGQEKSQHVFLEQKAHRITGRITYPEDTLGHAHTYHLEGTFADNVLTALARELGKARVDRGSLMLVLQAGYAEIVMKGMGIWQVGPEIVSVGHRWVHTEPAPTPAPGKPRT